MRNLPTHFGAVSGVGYLGEASTTRGEADSWTILTTSLGGEAWLVDFTDRVIYIDAGCPPADRCLYLAEAVTAAESPTAKRPELHLVR